MGERREPIWAEQQFTREQAIEFRLSGDWKGWTDRDIVALQLFQKRLCVEFSAFHRAIESVLGRPVFTHEFADTRRVQDEFLGDRPAPSFSEIMDQIPAEKRVCLVKVG